MTTTFASPSWTGLDQTIFGLAQVVSCQEVGWMDAAQRLTAQAFEEPGTCG